MPEDITRALDVVPHTALLEGEERPDKNLPRKNLWTFRSTPKDAYATLDEHWCDIMTHLEGKEAYINGLSKAAKVTFFIIVDRENKRPVLACSKEQISFIACCGGSLDVD